MGPANGDGDGEGDWEPAALAARRELSVVKYSTS